jgi:hypothetical protein
MLPADSGDAEVLCRQTQEVAEHADVGGIERLVAGDSAESESGKIHLAPEFVLDLMDKLSQCRPVPGQQ